MATATRQRKPAQNGAAPDPVAEAIASEEAIAAEAKEIRGDATELTPALFMELWPLLKRPIPGGLIQTVGVTKGKPYESTGIRSVQVQIDRMNNVLTPMWWQDEVRYEDGGKLATVTVIVGMRGDFVQGGDRMPLVLVERSSKGGVAQGSSTGNIYKGSYTNAAKIAFARVGPGHEVYLGAADLDPDTNLKVAEQTQAIDAGSFNALPAERVEQIGKAIRTLALDDKRIGLLLGSVGADAPETPADNGSLRLALGSLTLAQATQLETELEREAEKDV